MSVWPKIVLDLMRERRITIHALATKTKVHKDILKRFLEDGGLKVDKLESLLAYFGYHLDAFTNDGKSVCQCERHQSAAAVSLSRPANDAPVKSSVKKSARLVTIRRAPRQENADTRQNGNKPAKTISQRTGNA